MDVETFSESIQKYLRASGYTQKELADKLGLHAKVLSRKLHGTHSAFLTQQEVRRVILILAEWRAISTQDEATQLLTAANMSSALFSDIEWHTFPLNLLAVQRTPPLPASNMNSSPTKHNLPALTTRLIGREWAVSRLKPLLQRDDVRLVTLVGTGGSGKTRLALQVASELTETYMHGVWVVHLARTSDPEQVPMSIAQALQIQFAPDLSPLQGLLLYLRQKQLLLVLDNFEHVQMASTTVGEILEAAPDLKILVTSRAVLHVYGEREFSVPPLDVPDLSVRLGTQSVGSYPAVQLFVERAQAIFPDFVLTDENASTITQICSRVDGLPLALELAAARVKVLPPDLLLDRLSRARLPVLTGGARNLPDRQQTLRNTIAWSYNLLSVGDRACFRRLGVFTGGWSLEAAEAIMEYSRAEGEEPTFALDVLEGLLDQSLLVREPTAGRLARFTMLETLREYALGRLDEHDELDLFRDWHACYYLREMEFAAERGLKGPEQFACIARLVADHGNFSAALIWSLQRAKEGRSMPVAPLMGSSHPGTLQALEVCLRLVAACRPYWEWQGFLSDGRYWLKAALAVPVADDAEEALLAARACVLSETARLASTQNNQTEAITLAETSIALWRRLPLDRRGLATALLHRGWAAHGLGDYTGARDAYQEGLSYLSTETDPWLYAYILCHLASAVGFCSDFELMHQYYTQSIEILERLGDRSTVADILKDLGGMLLIEGSYADSVDYLVQSLKIIYEMNHKQFMTTGMGWLSFAVGLRKEPDAKTAALYSARLRGMADQLMEEIGMTHWSEMLSFTKLLQQHIRSFVEEQEWDEALAAGRRLTLDQAMELAMRLQAGPL